MDQTLNRNRLYALIGAFEDDLREIIRTDILTVHDEESALGGSYEKAFDRLADDEDGSAEGADIVDYLDLGDEIGILQRYRSELPSDLQGALNANGRRLDQLVGIRNRVMHRRPLQPDDYDNAARWLDELEHQAGLVGSNLRETLKILKGDAQWNPAEARAQVNEQAVPNNLPLPDFDETGLIGRRKQVESIKKFLVARRFPVLTLIGPGGIGKTALALQVLHELVEEPTTPFEMVAWVSLKTEMLTSAGVQRIEGAIHSIDKAIPYLAAPLDAEFSGSIDDLAAVLDNVPTLIAIDNLETVSANEILALIDCLPSVTWLFTSRVGLGQLERREPVGPLDPAPAEDLFRRLAKARHVAQLQGLARPRVQKIMDLLGTSPLAIKWFILAVESGQSPNTILRQQTDLMRFCVQNVYRGLGPDTRVVADILAHVHRPLTVADIKLHLQDRSPDSLRKSVQELLQRSLCIANTLADSLIEQFEATDPLVEYLKLAANSPAELIRSIQATEDEYRREEERLRIARSRSPLRSHVVAGSEEHRASALQLTEAFRKFEAGNRVEAVKSTEEVEQLDPEYWELFRIRAYFLAKMGQLIDAQTAYKRALVLASSAQDKAQIHFFYAEFLVANMRDSETAAEHAAIAHETLGLPATALLLGKVLTYVGDFTAAVENLIFACNVRDAKDRLVAGTQLVDTLRRRAEDESANLRSHEKARATLLEALMYGSEMLSNGLRDERLIAQMYKTLSDVMYSFRSNQPKSYDQLSKALRLCELLPFPLKGMDSSYLTSHANYLQQLDVSQDDRNRLARYATPTSSLADSGIDVGAEVVGKVKAVRADKNFGFIIGVDGSEYFFHLNDLRTPHSLLYMRRGAPVKFTISEQDGRPRAAHVELTEGLEKGVLLGRHGTVTFVSPRGAIIEDWNTKARVNFPYNGLKTPLSWREIKQGMPVIYDAQIDPVDLRVRALKGSVQVSANGR